MRCCFSASVSEWLMGFCPPLESKDQLCRICRNGTRKAAGMQEFGGRRRGGEATAAGVIGITRREAATPAAGCLPFKRRCRAAAHYPVLWVPRTRVALSAPTRVEAQRYCDDTATEHR